MNILYEAKWVWDLSQIACLDSWTGSCGLRVMSDNTGLAKVVKVANPRRKTRETVRN